MLRLVFLGLAAITLGCAAGPTDAPRRATVVWISIDGLRGDYLDRVRPPVLSRLAAEGASTRRLVPIFPSITFPNHIAQATGTTVSGHGIPDNDFFDRGTGRKEHFPADSSLLRAEPIWTTAKRQGLRVFVNDWPVSQVQSGPYRVDYSPAKFEDRTDQTRLAETIALLESDKVTPPPRLVMSYVGALDGAGHKFGPDAPEVARTLLEIDSLIGQFLSSLIHWFDARHDAHDELYLIITTDHGMQPLHTRVSFERIVGAELLQGVRVMHGGTMQMLYLDDLPAAERDRRADAILDRLKNVSYISAWRARDVPRQYGFSDPSRIGDLIVTLAPGYVFTGDRFATTMPIQSGSRGTHGYDPAQCPNMLGAAIVWRYRRPLGGGDFGRVDNTQWHATVARLLGIRSSPKANQHFIALPVR